MIIRLKNVRQHEDLTLEFPETGIIRLYGRSGIGKTTIFDAIEEALYGSASDMAPWGATKSSVELTIGSLEVVRTRGPQTLTVKSGGLVYKDDEAQELINKTLGMTEQEFLACSYIKQGSANSLLSLGPADQLRFIESLSVGDANPEKVKEKIKVLIKDSDKEILSCKLHLTEILKRIESGKDKISNLSISLGERPTLPFSKDDFLLKAQQLSTCVEGISLLEAVIKVVESDLTNPKYDLLKSGMATVADNQSRISTLGEMIFDLEVDLMNLNPWQEMSKSDASLLIESVREQMKMLETKTKMRELSNEIISVYQDVKDYGTVTNLLEAKASEVKEKITNLVSERFTAIEKKRELDALRIPQYCPSCRAPLAIVASKIILSANIPSDLDEIKKELDLIIGSLNQEVASKTQDEKKLNNWLLQCANLKAALPKNEPLPSLKSIAECAKKIDEVSLYILNNSTMAANIADIKRSISSYRTTISFLLVTNESVMSDLKEAQSLPSIETLQAKKDELITELRKKTTLMAEIKADLERFKSVSQAIDKYESIEMVLNELKSDLSIAEEEYKVGDLSVKEAEARLAAAVRLKELSDFAAVSAIDSTLEDVNACSAFFLEKMFPEDGTVIKLKNSTTTKTGEERAKLSVEVFHKGKYAKRLSNLSGGEKSRACLAFQLGLSELYKSPILMVDEGFSGLGDNDKEQCLEILHDVVKDKLVLVIEHGAGSSHFDSTINIGE